MTANLKPKQSLREDTSYQSPEGRLRVDRKNCVIEFPKILGWKSKNNRDYLPEGVDPRMYEGVFVNFDHPMTEAEQGSPRPFSSRFGKMEGIAKRPDGIYAEKFRYNPKHPMAEQFLWYCEHMPEAIGFSQNAFGDVLESDGVDKVTKVTEVRSIDIVTDPATTKGIFESTNPSLKETSTMDPDDKDKDETTALMEKDPPEPDDVDDMTGSTVDTGTDVDGDGDTDISTDLEDMDGDGDVDGADAAAADISDEMAAAANKIFLGPGDVKAKLVKIKELLKLHHAGLGEAVKTIVKTLGEAVKVLRPHAKKNSAVKMVLLKLDEIQLKEARQVKVDKALALCEAAKLPASARSAFFMEQLAECKDDRQMQAMIDDRRQIMGRPVSKQPTAAGSSIFSPTGKDLEEGTKTPKTEDDFQKAFESFAADVLGE